MPRLKDLLSIYLTYLTHRYRSHLHETLPPPAKPRMPTNPPTPPPTAPSPSKRTKLKSKLHHLLHPKVGNPLKKTPHPSTPSDAESGIQRTTVISATSSPAEEDDVEAWIAACGPEIDWESPARRKRWGVVGVEIVGGDGRGGGERGFRDWRGGEEGGGSREMEGGLAGKRQGEGEGEGGESGGGQAEVDGENEGDKEGKSGVEAVSGNATLGSKRKSVSGSSRELRMSESEERELAVLIASYYDLESEDSKEKSSSSSSSDGLLMAPTGAKDASKEGVRSSKSSFYSADSGGPGNESAPDTRHQSEHDRARE